MFPYPPSASTSLPSFLSYIPVMFPFLSMFILKNSFSITSCVTVIVENELLTSLSALVILYAVYPIGGTSWASKHNNKFRSSVSFIMHATFSPERSSKTIFSLVYPSSFRCCNGIFTSTGPVTGHER